MVRTRNPERAARGRDAGIDGPVNGAASVALPDPFRLYRGGTLHGARIAYESWGRLNAGARQRGAAVHRAVAFGARRRHRAGSDAGLVAAHDRARIWRSIPAATSCVCVNSLGSCFGSTGPASIDPATGKRYGSRLSRSSRSRTSPARPTRPMQSLGIERLAAVVGASLGGMSVVAFATQFPDSARRLITISGTSGRLAVRDRAALGATRGDSARSGLAGRPLRSRASAAQRHAPGAQARHDHVPLGGRIAPALWPRTAGRQCAAARASSRRASQSRVTSRAQAERFVRIFDPNCYLYLSSAMDRFDLAEHGGSFAAALACGPRRVGAGDRRRERHVVSDPGTGRHRAGVRAERRADALRPPALARGSRRVPGRYSPLRQRATPLPRLI